MGITRAATTATTAVIHITERITILGGRTTTEAIDLTNIIRIITTATKAQVGVNLSGWLGAIPSQPFFVCFLPEAESSPVKPDALTGERTKCASTLPDSADYSRALPCPPPRLTLPRISPPGNIVVCMFA